MKIYFKNNMVIITDGETAKVYDAAPTGYYEGVDLYAKGAAEQLKKRFREIWEDGMNSYYDIWSDDEIPLADLAYELEDAELVFNDEEM